ncbi:MAG TPA: HAMP domain-containing sensor histidine kinase [Chloroflexia bacterium]|nr:HAMP domain-containing sensor histidine kinase [Chloroflexia bacterium]
MLTTMRGRLIVSYLAVLLPSLLLVSVAYLVLSVRYKRDDAYNQLKTTMYLVAPVVSRAMARGFPQARQTIREDTDDFLNDLANTRYRLFVIRPDGRVVFDSEMGVANMRNQVLGNLPPTLFANPPPGVPVTGTLNLEPADVPYLYAAAPPRITAAAVGNPGKAPGLPAAYLILAQSAPDEEVVQNFVQRFLLFGILALMVAVGLGLILARSLTRPIRTLAAATHQIAQGNYAHQAPITGSAEMRELASDFNHMAVEVQRAHASQRDFLANVSHDLKTPLTAIQGYSQAMLDGTLRDPAAFRAAGAVINGESRRMARLVADLVDLVRLQTGTAPLAQERVDVGTLLQQAAAGMQPLAAKRGVDLSLESGPLPPVIGDPDRLHRAILNLLDNALRHTPPGGRVMLSARPAAAGITIGVQDTGSGIPASDLPHIFDRFYQVDKSRSPQGQGSGLGLAIVREVARAHGGDVTARSDLGTGSEFVVTLPIPGTPSGGTLHTTAN